MEGMFNAMAVFAVIGIFSLPLIAYEIVRLVLFVWRHIHWS